MKSSNTNTKEAPEQSLDSVDEAALMRLAAKFKKPIVRMKDLHFIVNENMPEDAVWVVCGSKAYAALTGGLKDAAHTTK